MLLDLLWKHLLENCSELEDVFIDAVIPKERTDVPQTLGIKVAEENISYTWKAIH